MLIEENKSVMLLCISWRKRDQIKTGQVEVRLADLGSAVFHRITDEACPAECFQWSEAQAFAFYGAPGPSLFEESSDYAAPETFRPEK